MKDDASRHAHYSEEHAPTTIHHPEVERTLLEQWFRRQFEKGPMFWGAALGIAALVVAVALFARSRMGGSSADAAQWEQLMLASTPEARLKAAEAARDDAVASWGFLQVAEERYQEALRDLPANRKAALPLLDKSYDLFKKSYDKAGSDDAPQRPMAAIGMARALEAKGDLDAAIERYQMVAKTWPDTDAGKQAEAQAAELKTPQAREFYEQFASFKPTELSLPPRGSATLGLPADHPPLDGPTTTAPALGPGFPPLGSPLGSPPAAPPDAVSPLITPPPAAPMPTEPPAETPPADPTAAKADAPTPPAREEEAPKTP